MSFVKTIAELGQTDLPVAGGKGANLGALMRAGLPVPGGFVVTTEGYRAFVAANHLDADVRRILDSTRMDDPGSLESASGQIRACFCSGRIPPILESEIRLVYLALDGLSPAVAVRSSATAEDLPDLSFAGQQDTYLNILGAQALLEAVIRCWASLWTARAIAYRARNAISSNGLALAVVVQQMVQSQVAGVLFTANPLTGKRSETVIDATFGLGEALVSGQVEPDHYVVETASGRILAKTLGTKALAVTARPGGGTTTIGQDASQQQALPDEEIVALTRLGRQAAVHMGSPQDLEWAWADGQMYVVQSRPITSLYPLPDNVAAEPLEILLSFGVWQGMLDPYTPLGQDMMTGVVAGAARLFGVKTKTETQRVLLNAGERLFINVTGLCKTRAGRGFLKTFVTSIDPVSDAILSSLLAELKLPAPGKISLHNKLRLARGLFPILRCVLFNLLWPARGRVRLENKIEQELACAQSRYQATKSLVELVDAIEYETIIRQIKELLPSLLASVIAGQVPLQALLRQIAGIPSGAELAPELTRGLPHNVTTQMDLALWRTAQTIQAKADTATYFGETDVATLVSAYRIGDLPPSVQNAISRFLSDYGMRGIGEIDLGRPRWNDDPTYVLQILKSLLQIDPENSPDAVFRRGSEKARLAQERLTATLRQTRRGKAKARMAKVMISRLRELGGLRETPKFTVIRLLGHMRTALLSHGQKLVDTGVLTSADDVFFLHLPELRALGNGQARDWRALIAERRATYQREFRRTHSPRILLSDGTAYYDASTSNLENEDTLRGSPVSAGTVEGTVRVVLDPHGAQLVPGEILVCPATDPAYTPLFLAAGGLVMQVGGMMTHGSVVAREYGIPAVVGVQQATERLKTGQRVRVDGTSGTITILPD